MMKKYLSYCILALALVSCVHPDAENPYEGMLCTMDVKLIYPEGHSEAAREGVAVRLEEINTMASYSGATADDAVARMSVPCGLYRISVSDRLDNSIFNATLDKVRFTSDSEINIELTYSKAGTLVVKEIYCGGCTKAPASGNYQSDKYIIIHNNDTRTTYLDGLCFGTLAPYNSNSANPWGGIQDVAYIIQVVWQFGGDGTSFPLESGEDAVICINGAIDHTTMYPESVNLNNGDYFVCYNQTYFTNTSYHPAPGDKIRNDHILEVVEKLGQANAYAFSINSPTVVLFRPVGCTMKEYLQQADKIVSMPGSTADRVAVIPWEWIIDGVEVFNGSTTANNKRIRSDVDAGYVTLSATYQGRSLMRKVDEQASAQHGYTVLADTNNSSNDFVELEKASLHHE